MSVPAYTSGCPTKDFLDVVEVYAPRSVLVVVSPDMKGQEVALKQLCVILGRHLRAIVRATPEDGRIDRRGRKCVICVTRDHPSELACAFPILALTTPPGAFWSTHYAVFVWGMAPDSPESAALITMPRPDGVGVPEQVLEEHGRSA